MANQLKHTPGPWAANKDTAFVRTADDDQYAVAAVYGRSGNAGDDDIAIANARLIAAAPELLDALMKLLNAVRSNNEGGTAKTQDQIFEEAGHAAIDAINKATGVA